MSIKFIYFDLANTLLYKENLYEKIELELAKAGYKIDLKTIKSVHLRLCEETQFPDKTSEEFFKDFNELFLEKLFDKTQEKAQDLEILSSNIFWACKNLPWKAFEDTKYLSEIKIPMGILSNWDKSIRDKLFTLLPYSFEYILSSSDLGVQKPDPKIFIHAKELCKCEFEEIMFVGDSLRLDIQPAAKLGIKSILIDRDNIFNYSSLEIGLKIRSLEEVLCLI